MADSVELIGPIDPQKKGETIDLGLFDAGDTKKSEYAKFITKLSETEKKYFAQEKPYDYRAAKADYEKEVEDLFRKSPKKYNNEPRSVKIEDFDFEMYGNADRFKLVKREPVIEFKLIDGIKQETITGYYANYEGTKFRNKVSVFEKVKTGKK